MRIHNGSIDTTHTPLPCHFTIPLNCFLNFAFTLSGGSRGLLELFHLHRYLPQEVRWRRERASRSDNQMLWKTVHQFDYIIVGKVILCSVQATLLVVKPMYVNTWMSMVRIIWKVLISLSWRRKSSGTFPPLKDTPDLIQEYAHLVLNQNPHFAALQCKILRQIFVYLVQNFKACFLLKCEQPNWFRF